MTVLEEVRNRIGPAVATSRRRCFHRLCVHHGAALLLMFTLLSQTALGQEAAREQEAPIAEQRTGMNRRGVITLFFGDTFHGSWRAGTADGLVGWQGGQFLDPFQFRVGSIRSIKFGSSEAEKENREPLSFELTNGDLILGELVAFTPQSVVIGCSDLGEVSIRPDLLARIRRLDNDDQTGPMSLNGLDGWRSGDDGSGDWQEDGNQILTTQPGAVISRSLDLPVRAVIDLDLSWTGTPDFVIAIGVDPESDIDRVTDGWRMETSGNDLALVREGEKRAAVDAITSLSSRNRIRLIAYLDRSDGTMNVLNLDGSVSASVSLPGSKDAVESGIRLINRGEGLRLARLHVASWVGGIPSRDRQGKTNIALANGGMVSGSIERFDPSAGRLEIGQSSGDSSVPLSEVSEIRFASTKLKADPGQCAFFLHGGIRLSGTLVRVEDETCLLGGSQYGREVRIPLSLVRSMVVFKSDPADAATNRGIGRLGRLKIGDTQSFGRLLPDLAANADGLPMRWHPSESENAARISKAISGKVIYRAPASIDTPSASARMRDEQRLRNLRQKRGLNFGELFLQRANLSKQNPVKRDVHVLHLRSGDVIACRVESIDESGVRVSTEKSEEGFVPHARIKAIELISNSPPPNIDEAKRERLLTIPRLQKATPPTHLLSSHNGDFLRCRLLRTQDVSFVVEVQGESFLVPKERVSQIIWFHPDESSEETDPAGRPLSVEKEQTDPNNYLGLVQVVLSDGKRVTFRPTGIANEKIEGRNSLVGECSFSLKAIDQIVMGEQIATDVQNFAYNQWKMEPAVEPIVTAAMQGGAAAQSGTDSPLVGIAAPEITLDLLEGESFQLSSCRGQIVVLDFWASWCAPCMQTMPLLTAAMDEFDPASVRLVSVNLEESAQQIAGILERQKIETTVALDIDGVAARRYQASAIPQLVVVGPDGNVERVYVGGGTAVVEQMKAAVRQLLGSADLSSP